MNLTIGDVSAFRLIARDSSGQSLLGVHVDWYSSDGNVVSVDAVTGVVTARGVGTATIGATAAGLRDSGSITVRMLPTTDTTQTFAIAFESLTTVGNYACGLEALTGVAYCWGDNHSGALGVGYAEWWAGPMRVDGGARRFRALSVSAYYNCAIERGTELPYCWGAARDPAQRVDWPYGVLVPTLVGGGRYRFSSISAGTTVACGIAVETSLAYCWGDGGLVGDGTRTARWTPTQVGGAGSDIRFATISASPGVVCGIEAASGRAYCWGENESGQLGDGTTTARSLPTLVANGAIRFASISAGASVTCGVEAATGNVLCWGANAHGQLGDGTVTTRLSPTAVATTDLRFTSVDAGPNMACAVEALTAAAYCWGESKSGSLGDGTGLERHVPTRVAGTTRFASVSTGGAGGGYGGYETCAVEAETRRAFCWGFGRPVPTLLESAPSWPSSKSPAGSPLRATNRG